MAALPAEINEATRHQHNLLNHLIIARLPLAVPPQAKHPADLSFGLATFAQIYFIFENEWSKIESKPSVGQGSELVDSHEDRVLSYLATLRPEGLHRSLRLHSDLNHLSTRSGVTLINSAPNIDPQGHIRLLLQQKPHVLLAYGWVMYMAIFSGGRWIRQQLVGAGPEFWIGQAGEQSDHKHDTKSPGLSFLSFDGEQDGEDVKAIFKARLVEADALLTAEQRQDVIDAAQQLFGRCIDIIGQLDGLVARPRSWKHQPWTTLMILVVLSLLWLIHSGYSSS